MTDAATRALNLAARRRHRSGIVFFTSAGGTVGKMAGDGFGTPLAIAAGPGDPSSIVVSSTTVFFSIAEPAGARSVAIAGGPITKLWAPTAPTDLLLHDKDLYMASTQGVRRFGQQVWIWQGNAGAVEVDSEAVYWTNLDTGSIMKRHK
ncbi:hypothetical protein JYT22_00325 [Endomicrobium sp. AH-315-J14]|nr:hypothetical protein [Endomicrobium sp. AH-315-J14]